MFAKRQDQVLVFFTWHGHGEVVVNAFFKLMQGGQSVCSGQVDFCLVQQGRNSRGDDATWFGLQFACDGAGRRVA